MNKRFRSLTKLMLTVAVLIPAAAFAQSQGTAYDYQILQLANGLRLTANAQTTQLNNLQTSANAQQTALANLQSALNNQQTGLSALQAALTSLQTSVTGLQTALNSLQSAVNRIPTDPRKRFYLTNPDYDGASALNACASGYHMASLWEILDVSNLRYDGAQPNAALPSADQGRGPSSLGSGWARTGWRSEDAANGQGSSNCDTWASADPADYGTELELNNQWGESPVNFNPVSNPWRAFASTCSVRRGVWCKEN